MGVDPKRLNNIIYPEKFNSDFIYTYIDFEKELKDMIERSGYKPEFIRKYRSSLRQLDNLKIQCTTLRKSFEKLRNAENLYSMKLHGGKNIRILFTFITCSNKIIAVLLYPFEEKDKKNNSKTGYNNAIQVANDRIEKLQDFLDL